MKSKSTNKNHGKHSEVDGGLWSQNNFNTVSVHTHYGKLDSNSVFHLLINKEEIITIPPVEGYCRIKWDNM